MFRTKGGVAGPKHKAYMLHSLSQDVGKDGLKEDSAEYLMKICVLHGSAGSTLEGPTPSSRELRFLMIVDL
ncbi:hypothetical protein JOB18_042953 [Solea senegalensis]|uniref:Uncharacterized protein n=1 Tax=Solea senegalensis TaxID=28829 RepID=A0AAV6Q833_SOLSE|nr:hypothetical protein JOB18_042953 [Solea senegalensis]